MNLTGYCAGYGSQMCSHPEPKYCGSAVRAYSPMQRSQATLVRQGRSRRQSCPRCPFGGRFHSARDTPACFNSSPIRALLMSPECSFGMVSFRLPLRIVACMRPG